MNSRWQSTRSLHDGGRQDKVAVALEAFVGEAHPMIRDSQQDGVAVTLETVANTLHTTT